MKQAKGFDWFRQCHRTGNKPLKFESLRMFIIRVLVSQLYFLDNRNYAGLPVLHLQKNRETLNNNVQ